VPRYAIDELVANVPLLMGFLDGFVNHNVAFIGL